MGVKHESDTAWAQDCQRWWGRVLEGEFWHWCAEWDDLPVDETCEEFAVCRCFDDPRARELSEQRRAEIDKRLAEFELCPDSGDESP